MVEDGDVGSAQGFVEVRYDVEDAQVQVDLEAEAARLGGSVPHHDERPVRDQRSAGRFRLLVAPDWEPQPNDDDEEEEPRGRCEERRRPHLLPHGAISGTAQACLERKQTHYEPQRAEIIR